MDTISKAEEIVGMAVVTTAATGAIPIPFADAPLLIGQQVVMMTAIAKAFKIDIQKDGLKALATAAIATGGATLVGRTLVAGAFKFIPGIGSVIGGMISASTAGIITYSIGKAFIEVCKAIRMGNLDGNDISSKECIEAFLKYFYDFKNKKPESPDFSCDDEYKEFEEEYNEFDERDEYDLAKDD